MAIMLFNVKLNIEVVENKLKATLLFRNDTSEKMYLDGMTLCWKNKIERHVFKIKNAKGAEVDYTGMMAKRILEPKDFQLIDNGEQFEVSAVLNDVYNVKKGDHYFVQYYAYNPSPYDPNDNTIVRMESNIVEVSY